MTTILANPFLTVYGAGLDDIQVDAGAMDSVFSMARDLEFVEDGNYKRMITRAEFAKLIVHLYER